MRRTKIVCTIGPATESLEMMEALIHAGMDVARLNFSHGSLEEHGARIERLRFLEKKLGKPIGILVDIQGPKIRLGELAEERPVLEKGERVYVTPDPSVKTAEDGRRVLPIIYPRLLEQIGPGQTIYLDDGLVELRVEAVDPAAGRALCTVVTGGELRSRKGVSLPEVDVDLPAIDGADEEHIRFAVEAGVDFVAASFVRRPEHVEAVREVIRAAGGTQQVIAKIESREGVRNLDAILEVADGIMVARGDMGVELPSEEVPLVQKELIAKGNRLGKPVITATQMLDSMARNPRPTRAEVTDVANAIFDGTDAVMLSGETAVGHYPVEAVQMMDRIARKSEEALDYGKWLDRHRTGGSRTVAEAIARATCESAADLHVKAILCSTQSGATARLVSKYRPHSPIIAATPNTHVVRQLSLVWGVRPILVPRARGIDEMISFSIREAKGQGLVADGDRVAIAAAVLTGTPGSTNLLQIHVVGEEQLRAHVSP